VTAGVSRPGTAKGRLQRACLDVLRRHQAAGTLPTSARFVYYELKQAGYPVGGHRARRDDQDVIDASRRCAIPGWVPWDWIADETRSVEGEHLAGSVRQWLLDVLGQARISPWDGQPRPGGHRRVPRGAGRAACHR
jgi:hypothetical protein